MTLTLRERCSRRLKGLQASRQPYEAEAKEIASYCQPARSRWLSSDANKNTRQRNARLNSSHGIFAFRTLQGGMTSGLSSPSRPWFSMTTFDDDMMHDPEVKLWLAEVEKRMYAFLASTNFYSAVKTGYLELGMFGTEACVMVEHPREGAVLHQLTFGEYWIGIGNTLTPEALYRRCPLTVNQAIQQFGRENLSRRINEAYDGGNYDDVCNFFHAIEVNDEQDTKLLGPEGMAFRSVYWDEDDDKKGSGRNSGCVRVSGYEEQPFWAPRWDTVGSDAWGTGPGHDALADLRELQLQAKRKGEATDFHVKPEKITSSKIKLRGQAGSIVSVPASELDMTKMVHVPYQIPYQTIAAIAEDVAKCEQAVDRAAFADLFMAITNMNGIQPRNIEEIAARNEEKLTQLGPVIERVNNEKLEVAIERTYGIMDRARLLPPPPEALAGMELKIEFVSILQQMQRMVGIGQIERTVGFVSSLMGIYPEARHKLKVMELVDEYASRAGAPAKIIATTEEAMALVEAEQQAAAQAQQAEMAAKMAPVGQVAVDAARLASEVPAAAAPAEMLAL